MRRSRATRQAWPGRRMRVARWWARLLMGSAFTVTVAAPAVALADAVSDGDTAPAAQSSPAPACMTVCEQAAVPATSTATREDLRQQIDQSHAQARYQLGSSQPEQLVPSHPYSQGHYQLGAGHQD